MEYCIDKKMEINDKSELKNKPIDERTPKQIDVSNIYKGSEWSWQQY